jgi:hypothetical protein
MSSSVASPNLALVSAKASEFRAEYSRFSTLAHRLTHGTPTAFFCFSATFWEQKPALPDLEAKRRAVPGDRQIAPASQFRVPRWVDLFAVHPKQFIHHRSNEMARVNSIEPANELGCMLQIGVWVLACTKS